jgi:hypothetical protein
VSTDFAARAGDLMANQLPRLAQRAERSVMKVLFTRGAVGRRRNRRRDPTGREHDAARTGRDLRRPSARGRRCAPAQRRGACRVLSARQRTRGADLQLRAFGANPTDAEVVGNLAFLRLKQQPAQPEPARQLALHALTLPDARFPHGPPRGTGPPSRSPARSVGASATRVMRGGVSAALAPNRQRQCRAAMDAYALYGERLRPSVESMLQRLHASGRADGTAFCSWPPYWTVGSSR